MHVTSKGQVTIPKDVRESMGIIPAETEIEFLQDEKGHWYLAKAKASDKTASRFRTAHQTGKLTMSTDEIMQLTRGEAWPSSRIFKTLDAAVGVLFDIGVSEIKVIR